MEFKERLAKGEPLETFFQRLMRWLKTSADGFAAQTSMSLGMTKNGT